MARKLPPLRKRTTIEAWALFDQEGNFTGRWAPSRPKAMAIKEPSDRVPHKVKVTVSPAG